MSSIREWLVALELGQFAETFENEQIGLRALPELSDADLKDLDLPLGPRRIILKAARDLANAPQKALSNQPADNAPQRDAERRQITVMFCDLVGSTALSETLDPEDLRTLMQAYQQACGKVIERYGGHVAQYLGDGLMTYFGWPQAHEDDAERSIRAGLEIIEAVKAVEAPSSLQVRIGIATGSVVVGETGGGDASVPKLAVGETPNLAARLQGLAGADEIVISPSTRLLVGGSFELHDLGDRILKGIVQPVRLHRVSGIAQTEDRFAARGAYLTPLVGREAEIALVMERWQQAKGGEGQVVLLSGEPGIGKSRITQALRARVADEPHTRLRYQCSPYYTNSALYPMIVQLERAAGFTRGDNTDTKLDKLEAALVEDSEATAAPLLAALLSLDISRYPALAMSPQKQKDETLRALADQVTAFAAKRPVLIIFEDAHWIDPTSQELLDTIVPLVAEHPVLLVITYRPEYTPPWLGLSHALPVTLTRLGRAQAATLVARVTGGKPLPDEVLDQIVAKTDGVPLFLEELTKTVLEAGFLKDTGEAYVLDGPLPPLSIPSTLQDSLMARLDRLSPVKEVAQIGACIGREFSYELLAAVSPLRDNELQDALQQLVNSGLIFRRDTATDVSYTFKHALVQDAAYESLLKSRRQLLHKMIAEKLPTVFPAIAETEPESLAHHYTGAGIPEKSASYWAMAGRLALKNSSLIEAIAHSQTGLSIAKTIEDIASRKMSELDLQVAMGMAYMALHGWQDDNVKKALEPAWELASELENYTQAGSILWGMGMYYLTRGEVRDTIPWVEETLRLAERINDPELTILGHMVGVVCDFWNGDILSSQNHSNKILALYDNAKHGSLVELCNHDPKTVGLLYSSISLWILGYPDQSEREMEDCFQQTTKINHHFDTCFANIFICITLVYKQNFERANLLFEKAIDISKEQNIPFVQYVVAPRFQSLVFAAQGDETKALENIEITKPMGLKVFWPSLRASVAAANLVNGDAKAARLQINAALEQINRWGECWYEAEVFRISGETRILAGETTEAAENDLRTAIEVAKSQQAKS